MDTAKRKKISSGSSDRAFFLEAKPSWKEGETKELHTRVVFSAHVPFVDAPVLYVTGCNFYRIYLNGSFLAYGPCRTSHGYAEVDEIPLALTQGDNYLEIQTIAYNSANYYSPKEPAFLQAEVRSGDKVILSTPNGFMVREWNEKLQKIIRYSFQRGFAEGYDFRKEPAKEERPVEVEGKTLLPRMVSYLKYPEYSSVLVESGQALYQERTIKDDCWLCASCFDTFPSEDYEIDAYRYGLSLTYQKGEMVDEIKGGRYSIFALEHAKTGFIHLALESSEEAEVYLYFDDIDLNFGQGDFINVNFRRTGGMNGIGLRVKAGITDFLSFEPYSAKYIRVVSRRGCVRVKSLTIKGYENPDADRFVFVCEDSKIQSIVDAARNNFVTNAVDVLTDCPARERAGWLCDSYFSGKAETLFTGENKVEENFLTCFLNFTAPIPEGSIPMCYPADNYDGKYIPNWCLFYVVEIADLARRHPTKLIELSRSNIEGIFRFFSRFENEYGLLENLESWVFVEWSKANDDAYIEGVNFPSNMMYAYALMEAGNLYRVPKWIQKAHKIYESIRKLSFNGKFFVDNALRVNGKLTATTNISEACQYYAFFSKTASKEEYPELYTTLLEHFGAKRDETKVYPEVAKSNAFIGNFLRLISFVENGDNQVIKDECIAYFGKMAELTGTLWEMDDPGYGSLNHGFASYVANLLVNYLTGYEGAEGNTLLFSSTSIAIDCHIEVPLRSGKIVMERKNGELSVSVPEGYLVKGNANDSHR